MMLPPAVADRLFLWIAAGAACAGRINHVLALVLLVLAAPIPAVAAEPVAAIEVRAHLTAVRKPVISAEISGRVTTVGFRAGQSFSAGALLLAFDCAMYQAQEARALAQRDRAQRQLASLRQLDLRGATSRLEVGVSMADLAAADADVRAAQITVRRCEIRAPFAGHVVEQRIQPGEYVADGQAVLELIDDSELDLEAIVPSALLARLQAGATLEVTLNEVPVPLSAQVRRVTPLIDPVSQTVKIFAHVDPAGYRLTAGMSGVARLNAAARRP